jgi:16S rRNA (uracil1498-N3)-methyltransferase
VYSFFCDPIAIADKKIILSDKKQIHHIRDVLRLKVNERVQVFDALGNAYACRISQVHERIVLDIQKRLEPKAQEKVRITLACAIPKKAKFDEIVDKLTQIGVYSIIPLLTERVVVRWDRQKQFNQQKRWEKIALSAAQQSQRTSLPIIQPPQKIAELLGNSRNYALKLIPVLSGQRRPMSEILSRTKARNILVLIGPEGDFTPQELSLAQSKGFIPVSLGDLVLRVDTAAIAAASFITLYAHD